MVKTVRVSKMTEEARNVFRCMCTHARVCMSDEFDVDGDLEEFSFLSNSLLNTFTIVRRRHPTNQIRSQVYFW